MIFRLVLPIALAALATFSQGCGNTSQPVPAASKADPAPADSPSSASSVSPAASTSTKEASARSGADSAQQSLASENAPKMPHAELPEDAPIPSSTDSQSGNPSNGQYPAASASTMTQDGASLGITGGWGRKLVGSCRLYFADESVRCREIYGNSQARFIKIFVKHCQTDAHDYDGVWSEQACPVQMAEKERVGGCLAEDPDYSTIAYSYVDPRDTLAKGLLPLVRSQCHGTYLPER